MKQPEEKTLKRHPQKQDLEFDFHLDVRPLIPDGEYEVGFVRVEKKWLWGGFKLFLWFQITTCGDYNGLQLYLASQLPVGKKVRGRE